MISGLVHDRLKTQYRRLKKLKNPFGSTLSDRLLIHALIKELLCNVFIFKLDFKFMVTLSWPSLYLKKLYFKRILMIITTMYRLIGGDRDTLYDV